MWGVVRPRATYVGEGHNTTDGCLPDPDLGVVVTSLWSCHNACFTFF